jgi:hypothetical protein
LENLIGKNTERIENQLISNNKNKEKKAQVYFNKSFDTRKINPSNSTEGKRYPWQTPNTLFIF